MAALRGRRKADVEAAAPGDDDADEAVADGAEPEAVAETSGDHASDDDLSLLGAIAERYRAEAEMWQARAEAAQLNADPTGSLRTLLPAVVDQVTVAGQFQAAAALHGIDQRVQELAHALPSAIAHAEGDVLAALKRLHALL